MTTEVDKIKAQLRAKKQVAPPTKGGLSTGVTLLNLALSGTPSWGLLPGYYYLLVGDSQAGKTWLSLQILAEASRNPFFKNYQFIYDNVERRRMDYGRYFSVPMATRLEGPPYGISGTSSEFYSNLAACTKRKLPCIYILDSEDALKPDDGEKSGWNTGKAIRNSSGMREAINAIGETGSILIVIKQTRDNIGPGAMFKPKTRSGGIALTFYACVEAWFSVKKKIKKKVANEEEIIGSLFKIAVIKNSESGRHKTVEVPFYEGYGMDDLGSMVEFLVRRGHWKRKGKEDDEESKGPITAPEFKFEGKMEKLISLIEEGSRVQELQNLTAEVWKQIDEACKPQRKPRYL